MSNTNEFSDKHELSDSEFLRYSRQLLLEDIGPEGQLKLKNARVLIIGLGGLGSPAALYLAAAGVGKLLLADDDQLDLSNLQRQILYRTTDINQPSASSHTKVRLAQHHLQNLNPLVEIVTFDIRLDDQALADAVAEVDLVLDCSDNMETRHQVNAACIKAQKTLISGSAVGFSGQLLVIEP
ncbi:molybdopterin-synthase adenylyltransferase MoeB, partial [Yersinia enterocolitica]|nr:molybdopterin-synthase adenylyltransferase MoeB [Yersinia enterocolitica]